MAEQKSVVRKGSVTPATAAPTTKSGVKSEVNKVAVILVRAAFRIPQPVLDTLQMLRLVRRNYCVVINNTPTMKGMITKVKDYVAWGEIDEETLGMLVKKRGLEFLGRKNDSKNIYKYRTFEFNGKSYKPYFRLNPPQQGFGRKGVKMGFAAGGALGYRGNKINNLNQRML